MNDLAAFEQDYPRLTAILATAEKNRKEGHFLGGDRSRGLEELLRYLAERETQFHGLGPAFLAAEILVQRGRQDYEIATECVTSGVYLVVLDTMRDVMEIEFLLRDFCNHMGHAEIWPNADDRTRLQRFRPILLRQRYAASIGQKVEDLSEHIDYKAHSRTLHVNPESVWGLPRGLISQHHPIVREFCFAELFEHARRLMVQVENNLPQEGRNPDEPEPFSEKFFPKISLAWRSTQFLNAVFQNLLKMAAEKAADDEPESSAT